MRSKINRILAIIFCAAILLVGGMTLIKNGRNFAYGFFKSYTDQLPKDPDVFDNVSARIYKLNYNAENRLWGRDALRHIAARSQMLPGKELINIAGYDMVRLTSGGYYNVVSDPYDSENVSEFITFAKDLQQQKGIPSMLVYCHTALYEDGLLPGDVEAYDQNNRYADQLTEEFETNGIPVVDSREIYRQNHLTMDEAVNKSDVHWTHRLALLTAQGALKELSEMGLDTDPTLLALENFNCDPYPALLSGEFAKRVGEGLVPADDVYVYYPAYETNILYEYEDTHGNSGSKRGSFREAAIKTENLQPEEAYYIYGHYLYLTHTVNEGAGNQLRMLIFKDSYGAPLSIFMGLGIREVYSVDTRSYKDMSLMDWVEKYEPDVVVFAYCEQTFRKIDTVIEE